MSKNFEIEQIRRDWSENPRWAGIVRTYSPEEADKLRGSVRVEHSLARMGAERFWDLLHSEKVVSALGAITGNQAIQEVQAGLKAIYCSGWQVAGDGNSAGEMYPDQSLYPVNSVPMVVNKINKSLFRRDQIQGLDQEEAINWLVPIVADAEAGFGGNLNAVELMKGMSEACGSGVHLEDQ